MATVVIGGRDTTNTIQAKFMLDVTPDLKWLEDDRSQLARFMSTLPKKDAKAKYVNWFTKEIRPKFDTLSVAITTAPASMTPDTITVSNGGYFRPQEQIQVPLTGENMVITGVTGNVLSVLRGWQTTPATAANGTQILNLGTASPEASVLELPRTTVPVQYTNYLQIFRDNVEISGSDLAIGNAGGEFAGDDIDELREEMLLEHLRAINLSLWFGRSAQVGNRRTLGGIDSFIPAAQRFSVGGTMDRPTFEQFLRIYGFRYGSQSKVLFCSYLVAGVINKYATDNIRTVTGDTEHGIHLEKYISMQGDLTICPDRSLEGTTYQGYGYLLDTSELRMRPLAGRDTMLYVDVQQPDKDAKGDTYLTETGFECGNPQRHAVVAGVTG